MLLLNAYLNVHYFALKILLIRNIITVRNTNFKCFIQRSIYTVYIREMSPAWCSTIMHLSLFSQWIIDVLQWVNWCHSG